jgi:endoglucanase
MKAMLCLPLFGALFACAGSDTPPAAPAGASAPLAPDPARGPAIEAAAFTTTSSPAARRCRWPLFEAYVERFVEGGRVVDRTTGARSTSEGQAYGLFFSLVAGDEALFDRIASWTRDNLLGGTWKEGLPAWLWGADGEGRWRILDSNSATDADLWMAYAFIEGGRLFGRPELLARGRALLRRVLAANLRVRPGLGPTLLPGPDGFELEGGRIRLNPSYFVPALFARFEALGLPGPWAKIGASSARLLRATAVDGHPPDWIVHHPERGFVSDVVEPPVSSYDAIRVPLFVALFGPRDLLEAVSGRLREFEAEGELEDVVPLTSVDEPRDSGPAPPGFYGALLPASARRHGGAPSPALLARLERERWGDLFGDPPTYYDQNLVLFGRGWTEGRFAFGPRGALETQWSTAPCREP